MNLCLWAGVAAGSPLADTAGPVLRVVESEMVGSQ